MLLPLNINAFMAIFRAIFAQKISFIS